jgi:hypothetical protein
MKKKILIHMTAAMLAACGFIAAKSFAADNARATPAQHAERR